MIAAIATIIGVVVVLIIAVGTAWQELGKITKED